VVFWDLRRLKQRSEFTESFSDQITCIRFDEHPSTTLYGCSIDGMTDMFDLTQPSEEEALSWCYKLLASPCFLSAGSQGRALVRTVDHAILKIHDGGLVGKIDVNDVDHPKHILESQF
jgi:hypothetical protein